MTGRAPLGPLVLTLFAGCANVNDVYLVLPDNGSLGLSCIDSRTGDPLIFAARDGDTARANIVVDYLGFDGVPSCRPVQLLEWCRDRGCPIQRRDCREVALGAPLPPDLPTLQARVFDQLQSMGPITRDAPDGVVLIRMTVTRQPCDELMDQPFRCADLLGCVYSCPVQLDEVRGDILLDLDSLSTQCDEQVVGICAGIGVPGGCE